MRAIDGVDAVADRIDRRDVSGNGDIPALLRGVGATPAPRETWNVRRFFFMQR